MFQITDAFYRIYVPDWSCKHLLPGQKESGGMWNISVFRMTIEMNLEITISFAFWCFCRVLQQVSHSGSLFDLLFDQNCVIILSTEENLLENTHMKHRSLCDVVITDMYISELVVRSNATLEATTVLALLNMSNFQVPGTTGAFHTVTIEQTTLVAGTGCKIPPSRLPPFKTLFIF